MCQRKARRTRDKAKRALLINAVDLVDHAINVVGQRGTLGANIGEKREQAIGALDDRALGTDRNAQPLVPVQQRRMRGGQLRTLEAADTVGEKAQAALRCDTGIKLAQAAGSGIARVGEFLLPGLALALVEPREVRLEHQHFTADIDQGRRAVGRKPQRNGAYGADILGDVLAGAAVTARGGLHQHAVDIAQVDRETIEFQFAGIVDILRRLEPLSNATVERTDVLIGEAIVDGKHGYVMTHLGEFRQRRATDSPGRRVRGLQLGMGLLELLQLEEHGVILGVRNRRLVEHVVGMRMSVQLTAEPAAACRPVGTIGFGGCAAEQVLLAHQANRRCARVDPAGMPACSIAR